MSLKSVLGIMTAAALVCQPAYSAPALGLVTIQGAVRINGQTTPSGVSLFPGDRLSTDANGVAEVALKAGGKILLPASSVIVLNSDAERVEVNLKQGSLAVSSPVSSPAIIEAGGARIKPASASVVLEVAIRDNSLKVVARRGSAVVETADRSVAVAEGKELDATMAPPSAGQGSAGAHAGGLSVFEKVAIVTALAGGLTGLGLGIDAILRPNPQDCQTVSPSGPGPISCP